MSRLWRQELAAFRRARREFCAACAAPVPLAIAVKLFTYALGPSRARGGRVAAQVRTEQRDRVAVCPRHLRALKRGEVLRCRDRAVTLVSRQPTRAVNETPRSPSPAGRVGGREYAEG